MATKPHEEGGTASLLQKAGWKREWTGDGANAANAKSAFHCWCRGKFFFCKWRIIAGNGKREHPGRKAKRQGISPPWGKRQKNFRHQKRAQNMGDGILTWAEGVLTWAVQSAVNHFAINPRVHPSFLCLFLVPCFQIFLSLFFFTFLSFPFSFFCFEKNFHAKKK